MNQKDKSEGSGIIGFGNTDDPLSYVADQYVRLFEGAIKKDQHDLTSTIIRNSFRILDKALCVPNNFAALQVLIDTEGNRGSMYTNLFTLALSTKSEREKILVMHHLVDVPKLAILSDRYLPEYVNQFISFHLFDATRLIIDSGDLELFTSEIDYFSNSLFRDPGELAMDIFNEFFMINLLPLDKEVEAEKERLQFMIRYVCAVNPDAISEFTEEVDKLNKLIKKRFGESIIQSTQTEDHINQIKVNARELYLTSKLYRSFNLIGAYLVFKESKSGSNAANYSHYIKQLWYHTNPVSSATYYLNRTPLSNDVTWLTMQTLNEDELRLARLSFDYYQDPEPYFVDYYALLLLKLGTAFKVPTKDAVKKWVDEGADYIVDWWYRFLGSIPYKRYLESLERIKKSASLMSLIKSEDAEKLVTSIRNEIEATAKKSDELRQEIIRLKPLDEEKVSECKRLIDESYQQNTKSSNLCTVILAQQDDSGEFMTLSYPMKAKRDTFLKLADIDNRPAWIEVGKSLADVETKKILELLQNSGITSVSTQPPSLSSIESVVTDMIRRGYSPNAIFIPLDVQRSLAQMSQQVPSDHNLRVGGISLYMIRSWGGMQFDDLFLIDSKAIQLTYRLNADKKRVTTIIEGHEVGNYELRIISSLSIELVIADLGGIAKITKPNVTSV